MPRVPLTLAVRDYAHIAPLALGDVTIEGVDLTLRRVFDAPQQVLADTTIDGGEASFSRHLQRVAANDESFVAVPAFVLRGFRQRCIFVRQDSPLTDLTELAGKRVGLNEWGATGHTWARAAFRECGIALEDVHWVVGQISPISPPPPGTPFPAYVRAAPAGSTLTEMLLAGEIDAMLASEPPEGFHAVNGPIVRLFRDFRTVERAYYARTGIMPAHHVVALRRSIVERHPWLPNHVLLAFEASRRRAAENRRLLGDVSPWLLAELESNEATMGPDAEQYGVQPNRAMIETFCAEQLAQGLVSTPINPADAFAGVEAAL
jgi:4,5-dihydroxyphthalate decarboxylase